MMVQLGFLILLKTTLYSFYRVVKYRCKLIFFKKSLQYIYIYILVA